MISGDYVIALFDKCCPENMKCTRDNILANICTFIELKWVLTLSFMLCNILFNTWAQYCTLDVCISFKSFYFMVYLSCVNMGQRTHRSGMNFFLSFCDRLCHSPSNAVQKTWNVHKTIQEKFSFLLEYNSLDLSNRNVLIGVKNWGLTTKW